jgi:DNA repair exonuclease SbcCD ATPase subunit
MHNILRQQIKDLASQLAIASSTENTKELLDKTRELYEKVTLLHYNTLLEEPKEETVIQENKNLETKIFEQESTIAEVEERELTVQERIQQIMDAAPKFEPNIKPTDSTTDKLLNKPEKISDDDEFRSEHSKANNQDTVDKPIQTASLEEELKNAISADYAAELFEKAEKIEITKKSLNDKLSQAQLQIGLNDRIAFVKHLFDGSQAEFNRVLSQLNSFQSEVQAKQFIETMVKPDYNWETKIEYEERLITLIEKKFL